MNKKLAFALLAPVILALPGVASAAPCKDAKGKFIKCPPAAAAKATPAPSASPSTAAKAATGGPRKTCRDAKGRFKKC